FDVSGVRVILRQNDANNVVAANLYLLGGSRQVTDANAGIEPVLLDVSERGTLRYPKNSLRNAMSKLGSEIVVAPSADWTMMGIRSSTEVFDSTWSIFADRVVHPTLAKSEIALVKAQYLSGIRQRRDDPDALADYLADSMAYVGHPYSVSVVGNEKSIQALDSTALRVATSVLTGRMFAEIRTRQNLTYDVHAPFVDRAATLGGLYVSTVAPDTTLKLMRAAIVDLQQGMLDPVGLRQLEQQFITEYFLDNETNAAQADFLARSQLYEGDYREADRF